jgi:hypothetical protein
VDSVPFVVGMPVHEQARLAETLWENARTGVRDSVLTHAPGTTPIPTASATRPPTPRIPYAQAWRNALPTKSGSAARASHTVLQNATEGTELTEEDCTPATGVPGLLLVTRPSL